MLAFLQFRNSIKSIKVATYNSRLIKIAKFELENSTHKPNACIFATKKCNKFGKLNVSQERRQIQSV